MDRRYPCPLRLLYYTPLHLLSLVLRSSVCFFFQLAGIERRFVLLISQGGGVSLEGGRWARLSLVFSIVSTT